MSAIPFQRVTSRPAVAQDAPIWVHMVCHVLRWVNTVSAACRDEKTPYLPYCLHSMPGRDERCIVNRYYKPLGSASTEWARYETATDRHVSLEAFEALRKAGVVDERGYLWDDEISPRMSQRALREYRRKLLALIDPYLQVPVCES